MVTKKFQYKDGTGVVTEYDIGAKAENVVFTDGESAEEKLSGLSDVAQSGSYEDLTDKPGLYETHNSTVYRNFSYPGGTAYIYIPQNNGEPSDLTGYTIQDLAGNDYLITSCQYDDGGIGIVISADGTTPTYPDETVVPDQSVVMIYKKISDLKFAVGKECKNSSASFNDYENNVASGYCSSAFGSGSAATGRSSFAAGYQTTAAGQNSFAAGYKAKATGYGSAFAAGYFATAQGYQAAFGQFNKLSSGPSSPTSSTGDIFLIGMGRSESALDNVFRVSKDGKCYGKNAFVSSGADYAEYFEWADGNPEAEDRRGLFVTLDGKFIRKAGPGDDLLGIVSAAPAIEGDCSSENWHGMYVKDIFGSPVTETVEVAESVDESTGETIPAYTETRWVLNPEFNPQQEYVSRDKRKEWAPVGMLGKLVLVDDGTCQVNQYCTCRENGIATHSPQKTSYRVMERLDNTHVRVFVK